MWLLFPRLFITLRIIARFVFFFLGDIETEDFAGDLRQLGGNRLQWDRDLLAGHAGDRDQEDQPFNEDPRGDVARDGRRHKWIESGRGNDPW